MEFKKVEIKKVDKCLGLHSTKMRGKADGFCTTCGKYRKTTGIKSKRLPNTCKVYAGSCPVCGTTILKKRGK